MQGLVLLKTIEIHRSVSSHNFQFYISLVKSARIYFLKWILWVLLKHISYFNLVLMHLHIFALVMFSLSKRWLFRKEFTPLLQKFSEPFICCRCDMESYMFRWPWDGKWNTKVLEIIIIIIICSLLEISLSKLVIVVMKVELVLLTSVKNIWHC